MKLSLISRFGLAVAAGALAVLSSAQIFPNQQYYDVNHEVILPPSSIAKPGHRHSLYLVKNSVVMPAGLNFFAGPAGFHPADIQAAYQMPNNGGSGAIAIVDAFDNTTNLTDFNTFSSTFGLPTETSSNVTAASNKVFQVVYASGSQPPADQGWAGEISLDIEWSHAMAPNAKIYLVEAASNGGGDLAAAVQVAAKLPGVHEISMSYGGGEGSSETSEDPIYNIPGVVCFASAGDTGGQQIYPAESPNVVGVGGTTLHMNGTKVTSETAWSGSGGGPSSVETIPSYQSVISKLLNGKRGCPDIAAIADPNTGVAVFGQFAAGGWFVVGGTSVACPVSAGVANTRKAYSANTKAELVRDYSMLGNAKRFRDITQGSAGSFTAAPGWDFITGCGCPLGLLGTAVTYNPTSVSTLFGIYSSGNLASVLNQDANYYTATSVLQTGVGPAATIISNVAINVPSGSTLSGITLTGIGKASSPNATLQLYAFDYSSGQYVYLKAVPAGTGDQTLSVALPTTGTFISGTNMQLALHGFVPYTYNVKTFTLSANQFQVSGSLL